MDAFVYVLIFSILIYIVFLDLGKIFIFNKANNLVEYICEKSLIVRIYRKLMNIDDTMYKKYYTKSSRKRLSFKVSITSALFVGYLMLICYADYVISFYEEWTFRDIVNNTDEKIWFSITALVTILVFIKIIFAVINNYNIEMSTKRIIDGVYNEKIKIYGAGSQKSIGKNIMNIEAGFDKAINKAVKSEKMKSELITNVSHDLKTPLTSIINYVDLLSKDNVPEDERKKYLEVISERSLRLKILIEDLFEAAKASSGAVELNYEFLDPVSLLRQTLGEFEDKIEQSSLQFIKNIPENKLSIVADGKKTFRIIQNLICNIIKYSMENSRVYIDILEEDEYVVMVFKNISLYPLNFSEDELMERFKRGDISRTTEGNGLGLSIAKSLTEVQGGLFGIKIDGDLFKAEVRLRKIMNEISTTHK